MSASFSFYITGTDCKFGKTVVSCAMLFVLPQLGRRSKGTKPIAHGRYFQDEVWCSEEVDGLATEFTIILPRMLTTPRFLNGQLHHGKCKDAPDNGEISIAHVLNCYRRVAATTDKVIVEAMDDFFRQYHLGLTRPMSQNISCFQ